VGGDRVAILGAGSVGAFIGGAWQAAGLPVSFIGRPSIGRYIRDNGLTISDSAGWQARLSEVDYSCVPGPLAEADVIALCVKSGATQQAAREIAEHGADGALVISFQNGVSNVDLLEQELAGRFQIARGMVPFNVAYLGRGHFHKGVAGELWVAAGPKTQALSERIAGGPASLRLSQDMLGVAWGKLLINLNNAVNALSGRTLLEELQQRDYRRVVGASMREGLRLLRASGIRPAKVGPVSPPLLPHIIESPDWLFNTLVLKGWKIDAQARSSMADDLACGRPTEIDYINGELVALADRLGAPAPLNRRIVELIRAAESGAPPWDSAALRDEVLGS
jgi:2-dehydropantoate 2-reductase